MYASAIAGIVIGLVSLVFDWLRYPDHALLLSIGSVAIALVGAVMAHRLRRGRLGVLGCHLSGSALWLVTMVQAAFGMIVDGGAAYTLLAILLMAMLGLIEISRWWIIGNLAIEIACWVPLGFVLHGAAFAVYALALIGSAIIMVVIHEVVSGFLVDIETLRLRDRTRETELAAALALAHHELAERHRLEEERERLREQLLGVRKMEAIGTLAGGVAHDMNNVLATILTLTELLREDVGAEVSPTIDEIVEIARRGASLTQNLLAFSRRGQYRKGRVEIQSIVDSVAKILAPTLPKRIQIAVELDGDYAVEGDSAQLRQALMNMCLNSADAITGEGTIRIVVTASEIDEAVAGSLTLARGRYVSIRVVDTGAGISREIQNRIFEPFFTTKQPGAGTGTGLGLAMVYGTMQAHGGAISVDSEPGTGTTMTLFLPAIDIAPATAAVPEIVSAPVASTFPRSILVVDDEASLRSATRRRLESKGYRVEEAANGEEALAVFDRDGGAFDLVLLDMAMPVMGGAQCFAELRRRDPAVKVLIVSGYALEGEARGCLDGGAFGFLEKPYAVAQLLAAIALVLEGQKVSDEAVA